MPRMADTYIMSAPAAGWLNGAGVSYLVETPTGVLYAVFGTGATGVVFRKSTDGGMTWGAPVTVSGTSETTTASSIWYDRWSNISAGLIHVAWVGSTNDDTYYRTIDTENADALSTETVIFAGASTASGGMLSITRAVGGNVYCRTCIDAGVEGGFFKLLNANVPSGAWEAALTVNEALATTDQMILLPDLNAADTQDIYGIFWDASAEEISRQNYDDSANTWAETSISTGMTDTPASGATFPNFAAAVDITNAQTVLVAWTDDDLVNADLKCWTVNSTTITAKTDVITNSTDDQGIAAIGIDTGTGYWHVYYAGKTDGSETFASAVNVYKRISTDSGTTWSAEIAVSSLNRGALPMWSILTTPRFSKRPVCAYQHDLSSDELRCLAEVPERRAQVLLGV